MIAADIPAGPVPITAISALSISSSFLNVFPTLLLEIIITRILQISLSIYEKFRKMTDNTHILIPTPLISPAPQIINNS